MIVVIGILAAITIVSYSSISNKAIVASLKNDLDSSAKLLKMYNVEHGYYPSSIDGSNCPSAPIADTRYCLKNMRGTTLSYSGGGQSFVLIETHTTTKLSYKISENSIAVENVLAASFISAWELGSDDINNHHPSANQANLRQDVDVVFTFGSDQSDTVDYWR